LKILSSSILHKSDVGGVAINLEPRQLSEAMAAMAVSVAAATGETPRRFLVQQMVRGGEELLLGIRRDPLGMVMLLGFGGITAELFGDSTIRLLPEHGGLSLEQAHEMMRELKGWPLLNGFRGRPLADQSALARAMVAFSAMAAQLGDRLIEAEINPLFVLPLGQGVLAADAVAVLSDPQQAQLPRAPDDRVAARHCKAASQALNHE
ncbi:MAG: acetate--CoA ligase family protein, partial [Quisquiliibacterium sp.]